MAVRLREICDRLVRCALRNPNGALSVLANIATLISLGLAWYAIVNPAIMSEYLLRIAAASDRSEFHLGDISQNTSNTAESTAEIALSVANWPRVGKFEVKSISNGRQDNFFVEVENDTNFTFVDVELRLFYGGGELAFKDEFALAPREMRDIYGWLNFDYERNYYETVPPIFFCLTAKNLESGLRATETRQLRFEKIPGGSLSMVTVDRGLAFSTDDDMCL